MSPNSCWTAVLTASSLVIGQILSGTGFLVTLPEDDMMLFFLRLVLTIEDGKRKIDHWEDQRRLTTTLC
jgi:hypothetical protein